MVARAVPAMSSRRSGRVRDGRAQQSTPDAQRAGPVRRSGVGVSDRREAARQEQGRTDPPGPAVPR